MMKLWAAKFVATSTESLIRLREPIISLSPEQAKQLSDELREALDAHNDGP